MLCTMCYLLQDFLQTYLLQKKCAFLVSCSKKSYSIYTQHVGTHPFNSRKSIIGLPAYMCTVDKK